MSYLPHAGSFRELLVYQKAKALSREIFQLSKRFPREEAYSLTDQIRQCSRSIGAQIAEAWAKRRYERHFISKLTDADGEQNETQHWIDTAADCNYLTEKEATVLLRQCEEIGRMLNGMINKADQFCSNSVNVIREEMSEYFVKPAVSN
ncbi:MAG: four helix bundle protein [candidate division KSB1 bacterium]|nr:four helix bundle protein [candidate division KSB1 bacterium]